MCSLKKERYEGLDILKCFCAFLVVCIHKRFTFSYSDYFRAFTSIAVPVFFMITGFFYSNTVSKGKAGIQIKKVIWLNIWANLFYFIWDLLLEVLEGNTTLSEYLHHRFDIEIIKKFLLFNKSAIHFHLWYLIALLYVLVIVFLLDKIGSRKWLYYFVPLLLAADLVFGEFSVVFLHRKFFEAFTRNFLYVGIPYFCMGDMLWNHRESIKKIFEHREYAVILMILLFTVCLFGEYWMLSSHGILSNRKHYISTTFLAAAFFILAILYEKKEKHSKWCNWLSNIGFKYSSMIYIIHPAFIRLFKYLSEVKKEQIPAIIAEAYDAAGAIWIFLISLLAAVCFEKLKLFLRIKKGGNRL